MSLTVLIIRHGEKPGRLEDGPGLMPDGTPDPRALTVRGWQRAGAWAVLFGAGRNADYPVPDRIIAPATDRGPEAKPPSRRPLLTVTPLAERLGLPVHHALAQGEETLVAEDLALAAGVVLIAWEHKRIITGLLPALLGEGATAPGVPRGWDSARFDVVLRLDRSAPGQPFACRQMFPRLLAGDIATPLG